MADNSKLMNAKKVKNDEFYTQLTDIENELRYYKKHFKNKIVFCNCDDPYESNFFKYFAMNFNQLGLKKLIATGYATSPIIAKEVNVWTGEETEGPVRTPYVAYINEVYDVNGDGRVDLEDVKILLKNKHNYRRWLKGEVIRDGDKTINYPPGDFRSSECITLLKQADIVVTNPPFSIAREHFVPLLMKYNKSFLIIGDLNWIGYKNFFPLLKENKIRTGYTHITSFLQPDGTIKKFGNKLWFTNLDIQKRHEPLVLYKNYNPEDYPKYDNYDAINVNKVVDIPEDYDGIMGVPITFLDKYNPDQFEIVGEANHGSDNKFDLFKPIIGGKLKFKRLLIRRRK